MPHVIVEYSSNIEEWGEPHAIVRCVHEALCALDCLPAEAIKTRAIRHESFHIGHDTEGAKGFITVLIRTRPGRKDSVLVQISDTARAAVVGHVKKVEGKTLSISTEIQMMDPVAVLNTKI